MIKRRQIVGLESTQNDGRPRSLFLGHGDLNFGIDPGRLQPGVPLSRGSGQRDDCLSLCLFIAHAVILATDRHARCLSAHRGQQSHATGQGRPPQKDVFGAQYTARLCLCERFAWTVARPDASLGAN